MTSTESENEEGFFFFTENSTHTVATDLHIEDSMFCVLCDAVKVNNSCKGIYKNRMLTYDQISCKKCAVTGNKMYLMCIIAVGSL